MRIALLLAFLLQFSISYSQVTMSIANVTGNSGGTVDVEFRVTNFTNVAGMQFSVRFDPAVITYNQVASTNNALTGFDPTGSFGTSSVGTGALRVSWNSANDAGFTLPANSVLFTVRFNVIGGQGTSSEVFISSTPTTIEFYDSNFNEIAFNQNRGSVTVVGGGVGSVKLIASNETGSTASVACVKISAEGFTNISTMQFTLQWNPSFMTFNSIGANNNSLNISSGNYNVNAGNGTFALSYNSVTPQTRPNGAILFEVCFLVNASSGSSSVNFVNSPVAIEIINGDDEEMNTLIQNGSITIGGAAPDCIPSGFTFALEHKTVQPGELFCISVRVFDFEDIAGLGMTYQWNPDHLRFLEVRNFDLDGLGTGNFGTNMVSMGFLGMAWSAPSGAESKPDAHAIFEICFEAIGPVGTMAMININGEKVDIEVLTESGTFLELFECPGKITISNELPFSVTLAGTNPSCSNSTNGAITTTISGGTGPFTYSWSPATATGPNPTGLGEGNYTVTVTDSSVPPRTAISSISLTAISNITVTPAIVPANCGAATGSITLNIGGNAGTPTFAWSNGAPNTNSRLNVAAGTYMVTISYGTGCTFTQSYTVPGTPAISVQGSVNNSTESVTITVTGGTPPYTYLWSNAATTQNIIGAGPGSFTVTVTDASECTGTGGPFVIGGDLGIDIIVSINNGFGVSCNGVCDGRVVAIPVSGTSPFTYRWSNNSTADSLVNVCAGMYIVTVTDAAGMTSTATANVTAPPRLTISIESFTKSTGTDGAATVQATGGVPGYTYTWNDPAATTGPSISGLPPQRFIVTATDANGCTATRPVNFAEDSECYEAIPAITPNGDGINDALVISCLEGTTNRIDIFDRWGRPVFSASNYANDWQGTSQSGEVLPDGAYYVVIRATESTGVERVERRSFSILTTLR